MKLGAGTVTWAFAGESLETALSEIASTGIQFVDLLGMLHGDPDTLVRATKNTAKSILADEGMTVASVLAVKPGINIATADKSAAERCRDYFKKCIELCAFFGTKEICFMGGHREFDADAETSWNNAVAFSRWIVEECAKSGVCATYELEWRTYGLVRSVRDMFRMIDRVGMPNIFANIDVGHAGLARDTLADMRKIAPIVIHLHLNDNDTILHCNALPGEGAVPIVPYVQALIDGGMVENAAAIGHAIVAGIEVEDVDGSGAPPRVLIEKSKDWILRNLPAVSL